MNKKILARSFFILWAVVLISGGIFCLMPVDENAQYTVFHFSGTRQTRHLSGQEVVLGKSLRPGREVFGVVSIILGGLMIVAGIKATKNF
jgi:hypothetical protein